MKSICLIVGLILLAPMALEVPAQAKSKTEDSKAPDDPNRQICRRVIVTGSMMSKKMCQTKSQWSAAEAHANDQMSNNRRLQGSAGQGVGQ